MHRRWTETPLLAGKSPEGCPRRDLLVDGGGAITCVWAAVCPSEKQKKKKLGCHFGRRIGIGSTSLAITVGLRLGLGVGDAVHRWGMGMQVWGVDNSTNIHTLPTGFMMDNKMC